MKGWRMSPEMKTALENEARREKTTVAALLDRITKEWVERRRAQNADDAEQEQLHHLAAKTLGTIAGGDVRRAERARAAVRRRLTRRHGR